MCSHVKKILKKYSTLHSPVKSTLYDSPASLMTISLSHTSLRRNFGPLVFTTLLNFIQVCRHSCLHSSLKVLWHDFIQAEVWILTGHLQLAPRLFSFSSIFAAVPEIIVLSVAVWQMASHMIWYGEEFMVDSLTTRWPGPIAGAYSQILTPQPLCFTVGLRCYADMHWFFFTKYGAVHYDQMSPLWCHLSKGYCSSFLVSSDAP